MRNIFLITLGLLFIYSIGNSQNIELYYEGNIVTNDTVEIHGSVEADSLYTYIFQGDTTYYYSYEALAEIDVKNISSNSLNIQSKKRHIQVVYGSENSFCWVSCFAPYTFESTNPVSIQANETTTVFSGHYKPKGTLGCTLVAYTFFNDANQNDSAMVVIRYVIQDCNAISVPELTKEFEYFSLPYPNPAKDKIYIKSNSRKYTTGKLKLYNNIGICVKSLKFNSSIDVLEINILGLNAGTYFYRIVTDNAIKQTGLVNIIN